MHFQLKIFHDLIGSVVPFYTSASTTDSEIFLLGEELPRAAMTRGMLTMTSSLVKGVGLFQMCTLLSLLHIASMCCSLG